MFVMKADRMGSDWMIWKRIDEAGLACGRLDVVRYRNEPMIASLLVKEAGPQLLVTEKRPAASLSSTEGALVFLLPPLGPSCVGLPPSRRPSQGTRFLPTCPAKSHCRDFIGLLNANIRRPRSPRNDLEEGVHVSGNMNLSFRDLS